MHKDGSSIFLGWLDRFDILNVLKRRAEKSIHDFTALKSKRIVLSPFLEIGGGRCQSAMILTNFFDATGCCTDISSGCLKDAKRFSRQLGMKKVPTRICCDAYNLPFRDESFSFAYCYGFLHHLPNPSPVLKEIKRVLKDKGFFYLGREPTKGRFLPKLMKQHPRPTSRAEKMFSKLRILSFISTPDYGVFEKAFDLLDWIKLLSILEEKEVYIFISRFKVSISFSRVNLKTLLCSLVVGSLVGLFRVRKRS